MEAAETKRIARRGLLLVVVVLVIAYAMQGYAPTHTARVVERAGPVLLIAWLSPFALAIIDAAGLYMMLTRLGRERPLRALFALRFGLESVASTAPFGPVAADASMPIIFHRALGLTSVDGVSVMAARKWALLAGHALCIALVLCLAFEALRAITIPGIAVSPVVFLIVMAVALASAALAIRAAARATHGAVIENVRDTRPASLAKRIRDGIAQAAEGARTILAPRDGGATRLAFVYLALWLAEAADTYVVLSLLGAPIDFSQALVIETLAAVAKSAAFVSPGGLGAQDAAYVFAIGAIVGPGTSALAVAHVVVRRLREVSFIVLGFGVLLAIPWFAARRARPDGTRPSLDDALVSHGGLR